MQSAKIYSVGSELAEISVLTKDILEEARLEDSSFVEKSLGIKEVRQAPVSSKPSDYAIPAGEKALVEAAINPGEIDLVIYCGIERDCSEPATAHIIASALGLRPNNCFDVANACHGFTTGMHVANSMIANGVARYALIVTAELSSKVTRQVVDLFKNRKLNPQDVKSHVGAFTVGDAGGAMILGPGESQHSIVPVQSRSLSQHHSLCSYNINDGKLSFNMDMGRISALTLKLVRDLVSPTYGAMGWTPDDVDLFIPHQVGARPFQKVCQMFGIDEDRSIATYPMLGNLASATLPVCYDLMNKAGRIKPGLKMLWASSGSGIVATTTAITM